MADQNAIINIVNPNAVVQQNTDYLFEFSITKPISTSNTVKSFNVKGTLLGSGVQFRIPIDLNEWNSISRIEVK